MRYSIIIPHYHKNENSTWLLTNCLESLKAVEPSLLTHTLVIDDASPYADKTEDLKKLKEKYGFILIMKQKNTSYSAVINLGIFLSLKNGYDVAVTMNNDIMMQTPFVQRSHALFDTDPLLSCIGGLLFYPSGKVQHMGYTVRPAPQPIDHHGAGTTDHDVPPSFVFGVTGALQILRLSHLPKYDERYILSYEDVAFCYHTWQQGRRVFYDPEIIATHHESATRGYGMGEKETASRLLHLKEIREWDLEGTYRLVKEANQTSPLFRQ